MKTEGGGKLDLLLRGGLCLTSNETDDVVEDCEIGISGGAIRFVRRRSVSTDPVPEAAEILSTDGCLVMPGLVNTHTHLPMVFFRGLADDLPLMDWLQKYIFPAEARHVNRDFVRTGSLLAMAEMILSGTTAFCDAYFHESAVAEAAVEAGMRAVPCQGFIDFPTVDNPDPTKNVQIAEKYVEKWRGRSPLVTPALFCHAPYTCSPETLRNIKAVAREAGVLYLTHLSETREEVETITGRFGFTPGKYLEDLGVLDERTVAVHCNWVDDEEIRIFAERGVRISHNPESSLKLAAGIAPVPKMLREGVTVGLGTDGSASNNDLDLFGEMGTAARIHKGVSLDPTVMDAKTVVRMATIEGAKALALDKVTGSIEPGKRADLIVIDLNRPHHVPTYNPFSQVVYAARGADVRDTVIDGRIVMKNRVLRTIDLPSLLASAAKTASSIAPEKFPR
ncbi:MAG TPA: amidohydrolase [Syntrophales bacterium]|nr:amidohydrolase [Syntrophales bacterium]HPX10893.1 amidohydrolase [Syntrophales bacterium]HQB31148.1 amidohydrolase [Syntrophales bacterium]HQN77700.1 amidohydrolase [Syntrophales bacterium]HQQ28178.1 amidohydrolase [Syntrophales bacterium]